MNIPIAYWLSRRRHHHDDDAEAYCLRAGVDDPVARRDLSALVRGLKVQGQWASLTEAWLLRSAHNAGSGTTTYGLKGKANGTLVNGPTWSASGMIHNQIYQPMTIAPAVITAGGAYAGIVVYSNRVLGTNGGNGLFSAQHYTPWTPHAEIMVGDAAQPGLWLRSSRDGALSANLGARSLDLGNWDTASWSLFPSSDLLLRNGAVEVSGLRTGLGVLQDSSIVDLVACGGGFGTGSVDMTLAAILIFGQPMPLATLQAVTALVKSTIGIGLPLP